MEAPEAAPNTRQPHTAGFPKAHKTSGGGRGARGGRTFKPILDIFFVRNKTKCTRGGMCHSSPGAPGQCSSVAKGVSPSPFNPHRSSMAGSGAGMSHQWKSVCPPLDSLDALRWEWLRVCMCACGLPLWLHLPCPPPHTQCPTNTPVVVAFLSSKTVLDSWIRDCIIYFFV